MEDRHIFDSLLGDPQASPIVIDNLFPPDISENFKEEIYHNAFFLIGNTFKGSSAIGVDSFKENNLNNLYDQFQLARLVVKDYEVLDNKEFPGNGYDFLNLCMFPMNMLFIHLKATLKLSHLNRCKVNLQFRAPEHAKGKYNWPHNDTSNLPIEQQKRIITALYYVNDCDGDTHFFNPSNFKKVDHNNKEWIKDINSLTIKQKISPKQGRMVLFRSDQLHAGSHPITSDYRIVINYNIRLD